MSTHPSLDDAPVSLGLIVELLGLCLIVASGKRNGIILLLSSFINAHTYISLYLLDVNVTSLNEFPIYSHCFLALLVLRTSVC